jgi:hypothetical protein
MRAFNVRFALKPTEVLRCRELTRCATFRHSRQRCRAVRKRYSHINERPPRPLARPQYQQSAPCWDRKKPRLWWAGLRITRDIRGSQTLASAAGQFRARGLVPERKAPPKRGQVYCGRKGTLGLPQQSNSGGAGVGSYSGERSPQESQSVAAEQQMSAASSPFEASAVGA